MVSISNRDIILTQHRRVLNALYGVCMLRMLVSAPATNMNQASATITPISLSS